MAGLRGNQAWLMMRKQTTKGAVPTIAVPSRNGATSPTAGALRVPFSGGNLGPIRETDRLAETDASRDQGDTIFTGSGVEGSPEVYGRLDIAGMLLHAALGSAATPTYTGVDATHVITPGATLPWYCFWKAQSDTLFEQYLDCKVGSLTISAEAGGALTLSAGIQGRTPTRLGADPLTYTAQVPNIPMLTGTPLMFHDAAIKLVLTGGGDPVTALVRSFELTIENNISRQQTDDLIPYDIVEGTREISLGYDLIFESLDEYNKFHYGAVGGTAVSSSIYTTAAQFVFSTSATRSLAFDLPKIAYEEFPVEPNTAGDPVIVSVRAVAQRGTASAPIITATVKNDIALY